LDVSWCRRRDLTGRAQASMPSLRRRPRRLPRPSMAAFPPCFGRRRLGVQIPHEPRK
jgi:hypothetical protein